MLLRFTPNGLDPNALPQTSGFFLLKNYYSNHALFNNSAREINKLLYEV